MSPPPKDTTDHLHPAKKAGKIRTILVLAVVAILVASAGAGTHLYMAYRLPDPETADIEGLFRWLVTADLSQYPPETHQVLIRRFEEEIAKNDDNSGGEASVNWATIDEQLTDEYRHQLWDNAQILLRPWFFKKMNEYHAASQTEKIKIVDQILDQTEIWKGFIRLAPSDKINKEKPGFGITMFLLGKLQEWQQDSTPEELKRLNDFVTVIQARWLVRKCLGTI
ncbi:MAG: hypothetical protein PVH19_02020 [Planctomycetia bacterium]|jgi:hypothetical protein